MERAWANAGLDPATATLIEAHGTSTRVGDVVEVDSLAQVFGGAPRGSIGLGSAKSNIGHLKAGAGAAGLLKATLALHHQVLPPTLQRRRRPTPTSTLRQRRSACSTRPIRGIAANGQPRRCGVSAYGFGGTNFHLVLEDYVPGRLQRGPPRLSAAPRSTGRQHGNRPVRTFAAGTRVRRPAARHPRPRRRQSRRAAGSA